MKTIINKGIFKIFKLFLTLFAEKKTIITFSVLMISFACISDLYSSLPVKLGQSVVTSYPQIYSANYKVVSVIDIRNKPGFVIGGHYWDTPAKYYGSTWTAQRMGEVFGITLDNSSPPNIFIAATDVFLPVSTNNSGLIFRIDGITEVVTNLISKYPNPGPPSAVLNTSTIPNTGCGLGNICYDDLHQQIFVTNFEDGIIYRIQGGVVKSYYNPFNSDDGTNGYAPLGQRIWGIGIYDNKVYFSKWLSDQENHTANNFNQIYSVKLNGSGEFINVPPHLEYGFTTFTNPVSDIEFSFNGDMLIGERSMYGTQISAHQSRMLEFARVNGSYNNYVIHNVGSFADNTNSCGGVDFGYGLSDSITNLYSDCDSIVASTGDFLYSTSGGIVYGVQLIKRSSAEIPNAQNYSQYIDLNGNLNGADKTTPGDIDIYSIDLCSTSRCDNLSAAALSIPSTCNNDCRWQVNLTHPADMSGIRKIQFRTQSPETFSSFTWNSSFSSWLNYSNTSTNKTRGPLSGNLPGGLLNDFATFCLSNTVTSPQRVFINWLTNGDTIVCSDTLVLYCDVPCMSFTSDTVLCNDTVYTVNFSFTNNSNFPMKNLELTAVTPSGAVITPSPVILNTAVPPGGSVNNVSFNISNANAPSQACILIKAISPDNCCWCYDTLCVNIPQCVCDNLDYELIRTGDPCSWTLNLINNYSGTYFTGIQTGIITSGVEFQSEFTNTWVFTPTTSPVTWLPTPVGSFIPLGNTNNEINFNLYGYTSTPQKMVLRWMRGVDRDTVVCTDTIEFDCTPPHEVTDTCSQLVEDTLLCKTDGTFEYRFKVQNNSSFDATGFQFNSITPGSSILTPSDFTNVAIPQNSISTQQSLIISGVTQGENVCFDLTLYKHITIDTTYYSICCHTDTVCITMPLCGTPCIDFNDQGISNWQTYGVTLDTASPGPSGLSTDHYIRTNDQGGTSEAYSSSYAGDWTVFNGMSLCFDFKVINDMKAGSPNIDVQPYISIISGPYNNPTARADFKLNPSIVLNENVNWKTFCAPIDVCTGSAVPANSYGYWEFVGLQDCSSWNTLLSNVSYLILSGDCYTNANDVSGFDNICIKPCPTYCDSIKVCAKTMCPTDQFTVCIANSVSPFDVVQSVIGYPDSQGCGYYKFSDAIPGESYYIVVKTANSLETWSASPQIVKGETCLEYDFTSDSSMAYGGNMININGVWTLLAGDINQDGVIDLSDLVAIHNDASIFTTGITDLNCNGVTDLSDIIIAHNNSSNFAQVKKPQ